MVPVPVEAAPGPPPPTVTVYAVPDVTAILFVRSPPPPPPPPEAVPPPPPPATTRYSTFAPGPADGLIDDDGLNDRDAELDGLCDRDAELDGLCELDGLNDALGLRDGTFVMVNVPVTVKVWMVFAPLVVIVPPVAVSVPVG